MMQPDTSIIKAMGEEDHWDVVYLFETTTEVSIVDGCDMFAPGQLKFEAIKYKRGDETDWHDVEGTMEK